MVPQLTPAETRVLGSLVEKELSTPEYYPLTLNALVAACNQRSNRDPVMTLGEDEVASALETLRRRGLARQSAEGVRTVRFCHSLAERFLLEPPELAILAELLLRGPQTAAELRSRSTRMTEMPGSDGVARLIEGLTTRDEPLLLQLPREPGKKERRYTHTFSPPPAPSPSRTDLPEPLAQARQDADRIESLEREIARLSEEMRSLREEFRLFRTQFE